MKINNGDFIELDYTAKLIDEDKIFDTTEVEAAKIAGILHDHDEHKDGGHNHEHNHLHKEDLKPIIICVGEKHILPGLDNKLAGLEIGKHKIELTDVEAFGKKNTKLLKLMPIALFNEQKIRPYVGLTLDIDGSRGIVRSISGGRVIVDFNHPLAGKKVEYSINIKRNVTSHKEQLEAVLKLLRFPFSSVDVADSKAKINIQIELPKEVKEALEKDLSRITKIDVQMISEKKTEDKVENKIENKDN